MDSEITLFFFKLVVHAVIFFGGYELGQIVVYKRCLEKEQEELKQYVKMRQKQEKK